MFALWIWMFRLFPVAGPVMKSQIRRKCNKYGGSVDSEIFAKMSRSLTHSQIGDDQFCKSVREGWPFGIDSCTECWEMFQVFNNKQTHEFFDSQIWDGAIIDGPGEEILHITSPERCTTNSNCSLGWIFRWIASPKCLLITPPLFPDMLRRLHESIRFHVTNPYS
jgi:hypothetical protein